jgi:hypothetical protein
VAQSALAGQQDIANNAVLAGLNTSNFQNAESEFNNQQTTNLGAAQNTAARQLAASQQLGTLGSTAQGEALNEANAQTNAGTLEQTTQQAQDTAAYNQFLQQQAYPFQTTGWLANIVEGIGSQSGGSSTGQTTTTGSTAGAVAGGLLGLGSLLKRGGRVPHKAIGGGLVPYGSGIDNPTTEVPTGLGGGSFVPTIQLPVGHTMPNGQAPNPNAGTTANQNQFAQMGQVSKGIQGLGNAFQNTGLGDSVSDALQDFGDSFARGGLVLGDGGLMRLRGRKHYDDGGNVDLTPESLLAAAVDPLTGQPTTSSPAIGQQADALGTPNAALAAQYKNQMPAPPAAPNSGLASAPTPSLADEYANGNMPAPSQSAPPGGLAQLGAAMGASTPSPASPYGDLTDAGGAPLPPVRPIGLGDASLDTATVPPVPVVASAPMQLPSGQPGGLAPADNSGVAGVNPDARGMRNNNPGNLEANSWTAGLPGYTGSDGRFAIFSTPQQGMAALDRNLQGYAAKGISTPLQIASTWAPSGGGDNNNPVGYGATIAKALGVGLNDKVDLTDPNVRSKVGQAIAFVENGQGSSGLASTPASAAIASATGQPNGRGGLGAPTANPGEIPNAGGLGGNPANLPVADGAEAQAAPERTGLLGLNLSDAQRQGLLAAGLGMMAGTSRSGLVNIGQGGLQGIAAYNNARNMQSEIDLRRAQAERQMVETGLLPAKTASEIGLQQGEAGLYGANAAKVAAETPGVQAESEIKQSQVKMMHDALAQQEAEEAKRAKMVAANADGGPSASGTPPASTPGAPNAPMNGRLPASAAPAPAPLDPNFDPNVISSRIQSEKWVNPQAAASDRDLLDKIMTSGKSRDINGNVVNLPGAVGATAEMKANEAGAEESAKSHYELQEVQDTPGGPTRWVPKSQVIAGQTPVSVGAGSPPGAGADAAAVASPTIAKQPEFYAEKQKQIAADEGAMVQNFQARQLSRQRLQTLGQIMQNYQPGAFAQQKADIVASLRSVGVPVSNTDTANPAAFQEFTKNAIANVFNDVKAQGGRVLVSEIEGLTKANANAELQPAAAAAIIGQGLGIINYEDQHVNDYFAWKHQKDANGNMPNMNTVDTSDFELNWVKNHPVSQYVGEATRGIGYSGQAIPADPTQRVKGQVYQNAQGRRAAWTGTGWAPVQ